jgi:hypothetical protein
LDFKLIRKIIYIFIISLSFSGCISNNIFLEENFKQNISSKKDYKIILIDSNINSKLYRDIKLVLSEEDWKIIRHNGSTEEVEWNKQYKGLPKYVLLYEIEKHGREVMNLNFITEFLLKIHSKIK